MKQRTPIDPELIAKHNARLEKLLNADYQHLGEVLARRGEDLEAITTRVQNFAVAIPSWGVGSGGTRFARFPVPGEPRNVFEKIEDCAAILQLGRATPTVSPHFPWDKVDDYSGLREFAHSYGIVFDAVNSNTFEDQPGQLSYKYGSLTHTNKAVREQAIAHNLECIDVGLKLGSRALTVWIGDGSNFPGQLNMTAALERYLESMKIIVAALPNGWRAFIEHKLYEPALYSTVIADWGTSYICATQLGANVQCLVDLGHHAPTTNIEQIVSRLIQIQRLGGFHFNDSKYGDDDLDTGAINPFQIFLIFNELVDAELRGASGFAPAYMLDQSHNVTDPVESMLESEVSMQRAYAQALMVNREALLEAQDANDALIANRTLRAAVEMDVEPVIKMARMRMGGAIDPVGVFRASRYRQCMAAARPQELTGKSGIV